MRRRDPSEDRPPSPERGAGNSGSAEKNLPRFSSTPTTVPGACASGDRDLPLSEPADLAEDLPGDLPADLSEDLPGDLPVDLRPVLT